MIIKIIAFLQIIFEIFHVGDCDVSIDSFESVGDEAPARFFNKASKSSINLLISSLLTAWKKEKKDLFSYKLRWV